MSFIPRALLGAVGSATGLTNLISNGGFETAGGGGATDADDWTQTDLGSGGTAQRITNGQQLTGAAAMRLQNTLISTGALVSQVVTVNESTSYRLVYYGVSENDSELVVSVSGTGVSESDTLNMTDEYARYTLDFSTPAGTTSVTVQFICYGSGIIQEVVILDEVSVVEAR